METKVCNKCGLEKSVEDFTWRDKAHLTRYARCKSCMNAYVAKHYKENEGYRERRKAAARAQPPKTNEDQWKDSIKYKYGITPFEYEQLLYAQFECCAICGSDSPGRDDPDKKWKAGRWNIDHDHKTGRVRGLLCHTCNVQVGAYEKLLEKVSKYELNTYIKGELPTRHSNMINGMVMPAEVSLDENGRMIALTQ